MCRKVWKGADFWEKCAEKRENPPSNPRLRGDGKRINLIIRWLKPTAIEL